METTKTVFDITPENAFEPELRRLYLGGTDIAAICCLSDYKTPFEVWLEKTGQSEPEELTQDQQDLFYWGHALEGPIAAKWIEDNPDWEIVTVNEFTVDPEYTFLCSNTDRKIKHKVTGEIAILECKTVASTAFKNWKLGVPLNYYGQGQHYLGIGGYDRMFFALFVMDSRKLVSLEVVRDDVFIEEIRGLAITFWNDSVIKMLPPDKTVFDWAKTQAVDESVVASQEIARTVIELKAAKAAEKLATEKKAELEEKIKMFMQDKKVLVAPDDNKMFLATWNGSDVTRADPDKIKKEYADIWPLVSKTKYERKFLLK